MSNSPKLDATQKQAADTAAAVKAMKSQAGSVPVAAGHLSAAHQKTGLIQDTNVTGSASAGATGPQIGGAAAHTHNMAGTHAHNPDDHTHFNQLLTEFDALVDVVNAMRTALIAEGIL